MKLDRYLLMGAAILLLLPVFGSCKKKNEDPTITYESFKGSPTFTLPEIVSPGEQYTLKLADVSREDEGGFGCYWKVSIFDQNDTTRVESDPTSKSPDYTFTIPDTLCNFSVSVTVFASGYAALSTSNSATIVSDDKENGSVTGREFGREGEFIFTDGRDDKEYWCTHINGQDWFKENLAYSESGVSYFGSDKMDTIFGKYYNWDEAQSACPDGWRLASGEDWKNLANYLMKDDFGIYDTFVGVSGSLMANAYFNLDRMWEFWPDVKITDRSGLSVIPVGYAMDKDDDYDFLGYMEYAAFWTADEYNDEQGLYRYIYVSKPDCYVASSDKQSFRASVRCVRDSE